MDPWNEFLEVMKLLWIQCGCGTAAGVTIVMLCLSAASSRSSGSRK